jgi:hypothetical protein
VGTPFPPAKDSFESIERLPAWLPGCPRRATPTRTMKTTKLYARYVWRTCAVIIAAFTLTAQTSYAQTLVASKDETASDEKAEQIVKRAIDAMGGAAYLGVRSIASKGNYTPYDQGIPALPIGFVDYIVFPDRERTEFKGRGVRSIQTNTGDTGWLFDGMVRKIKDLTTEQIEDFKTANRTSLDNLLRGWWRSSGGRLTYLGRREGGLGTRNEAIRLNYPDGFSVEYEFRAKDGLPAKTKYKKKSKEGEEVEEEDRYAQHLPISGVIVPFVIDHYRAGQQSSRVNFESVELNAAIAESLFTRPTDPKAIKQD